VRQEEQITPEEAGISTTLAQPPSAMRPETLSPTILRELTCFECGYGICCAEVPRECPMCHGTAWLLGTGRSPRRSLH
jgi:hypothetical protein